MKKPFHATVEYVDLKRFSGDWYVIALIPTPLEKKAYRGIENYQIDKNNRISVLYTYRKGSLDGPEKQITQRGWVENTQTNAEWRVQPIWPLRLPYYVLELEENYRYTVVGTNGYRYLWIMSRDPEMEEVQLSSIIDRMTARGYDRHAIIRMPQGGSQ